MVAAVVGMKGQLLVPLPVYVSELLNEDVADACVSCDVLSSAVVSSAHPNPNPKNVSIVSDGQLLGDVAREDEGATDVGVGNTAEYIVFSAMWSMSELMFEVALW